MIWFSLLMSLGLAWDSSSNIELRAIQYASDVESISHQSLALRATSENTHRVAKKMKLKVTPFIEADFLAIDSSEKFFADPYELHLRYDTKKSTWSLGYFQIKSEGTDVLNPFDVIQPKRFKYPVSADRLGMLGLKLDTEIIRNLNLEVFYLPKNRKSQLPGEHSVWWPRKNRIPIETEGSELRLPAIVEYQFGRDEVADGALENNGGLKLKYTGSFFDLHFMYFDGVNPTPDISPELTGTLVSTTPHYIIDLDNPVILNFHWQRAKNIGVGLSLQLAGFIIRSFGRRQTINDSTDDWVVTEIEKNFVIFGRDLTLFLEASRGWDHRSDDDSSMQTLTSIYYNANIFGMRLALSDTKSIVMGFLKDEKYEGSLASLDYSQALTDSWKLKLGAQLINGPSDSFYAVFKDNSSYSLSLLRYF